MATARTPASEPNRHDAANLWPILAGVRFLLAVVVVSSHWTYVEKNTDPFFRYVSPFGGFAAVLGFLIISGYSIAHSYTVEAPRFFARRAARIFPVYIVCTAGLWALFAINGEPGLRTTAGSVLQAPTLADTLQNLLMLQGATTGPTVSPAWSLSIECWFYLLAPLLACCRLNVVRGLALAPPRPKFAGKPPACYPRRQQ